jgi:hypothetical protein
MKKWARILKRAVKVERDKANLAIVAANNHYAGFGPGTANIFRKMLGLEEATWKNKKVPLTKENKSSSSTYTKQTTLSDFENEV